MNSVSEVLLQSKGLLKQIEYLSESVISHKYFIIPLARVVNLVYSGIRLFVWKHYYDDRVSQVDSIDNRRAFSVDRKGVSLSKLVAYDVNQVRDINCFEVDDISSEELGWLGSYFLA